MSRPTAGAEAVLEAVSAGASAKMPAPQQTGSAVGHPTPSERLSTMAEQPAPAQPTLAASEQATNRVVEMEVPARSDYVSFVRRVVAATARIEPSLKRSTIDDLRVAVSEATTNAVQAHQRAGVARPIKVVCQREANQVRVMIRDFGDGFDVGSIAKLPAPESPERLRHESGLGISIMRELAYDSSIVSGRGGTEVRLVVRDR